MPESVHHLPSNKGKQENMNTATKSTNLANLVYRICHADYQELELTQFVNLVQKVSLSYLKYQEVIGKHIRWERNKNLGELDDLALDCVAGLFMRNDLGEFIQLKKYFCQNTSNINNLDDAEILVLLRRLVIKKTKQELSRIFKERDPEGAKIVRNIKVAIKSSSDFSSFKEMGREYIYFTATPKNGPTANGQHYPNCNNSAGTYNDNARKKNRYQGSSALQNGQLADYLRKSQPAIQEKFLRSEYLNLYCPKDPVSAGIRKMLSAVKNDMRYQNFLPLDMIARIMRNTNFEMARDRLSSQVTDVSPLDALKLKEIEKRKNLVLERIREKIQNQYVLTNKISVGKGEVYFKALNEILDDISHGKKYDSYYKHLRRYIPNLTQRSYRSKERTIFEYLGKLIKKWFRESLLELL